MRQIVLMWLFWICVTQSLLRYPIKRLATYIAHWGEPSRDSDDYLRRFSPPYLVAGLYGRERREMIEKPNRETLATIFRRRGEERAQRPQQEIAYGNHLNGVHNFGYCEWCGPRYFYD